MWIVWYNKHNGKTSHLTFIYYNGILNDISKSNPFLIVYTKLYNNKSTIFNKTKSKKNINLIEN